MRRGRDRSIGKRGSAAPSFFPFHHLTTPGRTPFLFALTVGPALQSPLESLLFLLALLLFPSTIPLEKLPQGWRIQIVGQFGHSFPR
jgi:hypothetical protein